MLARSDFSSSEWRRAAGSGSLTHNHVINNMNATTTTTKNTTKNTTTTTTNNNNNDSNNHDNHNHHDNSNPAKPRRATEEGRWMVLRAPLHIRTPAFLCSAWF